MSGRPDSPPFLKARSVTTNIPLAGTTEQKREKHLGQQNLAPARSKNSLLSPEYSLFFEISSLLIGVLLINVKAGMSNRGTFAADRLPSGGLSSRTRSFNSR